jgi:ABC-2 type transport system permease protein
MMFLCGLFIPVEKLPLALQPVSYVLPLTYGADMLHGAIAGGAKLPIVLDIPALIAFCLGFFWLSLWQVKRKWII